MSDPNYEHIFRTNRKGLCQQIVSGKLCHLPEDAVVHTRWVERHPDVEQEPHADDLQARLSRYETAMREALRILGPAWRYKDAAAILCAALSDQPAVNSTAFTRGDGDRALDCLIKNMRTTSTDQPAEEPAESKLEAKCERRVLEARIDEHAKTCGDCNETNLCDDMLELRRWLAVLDAQPSTPEPKGEI